MKPVEALNRLLEFATDFCVSQTFFTACNLGLFEQLGQEPATADGLAQKLHIHPEACRRLLMVLVHLALVQRENNVYRNSELGQYCTSKAPTSLEPISMWGNPFYHMWEFLPDALREFSPRWQQAVGAKVDDVFAALYSDPVRLKRFVSLTYAYGVPQGQVMAERFDFSSRRQLLDVAGGAGGMAIAIGKKYPHLRGVVMDLPPVCPLAAEYIAANGLSDRFSTAVADLFTGPYPPGADILTLGFILHDWNDEKCHAILKNCYAALPAGGVLLVSEKVLNNDFTGSRNAVLQDLHMLVCSEAGGKERTEAEYGSLLEGAGFKEVEVIRLDAPRDMIVAQKPRIGV
jgi:acetylserotonin N-methyltransferase